MLNFSIWKSRDECGGKIVRPTVFITDRIVWELIWIEISDIIGWVIYLFLFINLTRTEFSLENGASMNPCSETYAGPHQDSEPETRSLQRFINQSPRSWDAYLTFHSYGQYWIYPWGFALHMPDDYRELVSENFSLSFANLSTFFFRITKQWLARKHWNVSMELCIKLVQRRIYSVNNFQSKARPILTCFFWFRWISWRKRWLGERCGSNQVCLHGRITSFRWHEWRTCSFCFYATDNVYWTSGTRNVRWCKRIPSVIDYSTKIKIIGKESKKRREIKHRHNFRYFVFFSFALLNKNWGRKNFGNEWNKFHTKRINFKVKSVTRLIFLELSRKEVQTLFDFRKVKLSSSRNIGKLKLWESIF